MEDQTQFITGKSKTPRGPTLKRAKGAIGYSKRPPKLPEQSEADLTKAIRALLRSQGIWHYKAWGGPMAEPGIPDIIGIWKNQLMAIEVKTKTGKLSEHQVRKIDEINRAGGLAFVARDLDDVIEKLNIGDRFLFAKGRNLP